MDAEILGMSPEKMREKALKGYFVRDVQRNLVYCPSFWYNQRSLNFYFFLLKGKTKMETETALFYLSYNIGVLSTWSEFRN